MTDIQVLDGGDAHVPTLTVAVDPGMSVGIAALLDTERFLVVQFRIDRPGGRELVEATLRDLFAFAHEHEYQLLVGTERFVVNGRTARLSQQNDAQQVIGVVRATSPVDVEVQSAAAAHQFASNARLRKLGLWITPTMVGCPDADDANSAMRHAVLLLARKRARLYEALVRRAS